jgi:hypothetical protein
VSSKEAREKKEERKKWRRAIPAHCHNSNRRNFEYWTSHTHIPTFIMSAEHRMVPWRDRLRRSASRAPYEELPPEEKYRQVENNRSRSVSPVVEEEEEVRGNSHSRHRRGSSKKSLETPPTRAEMHQAILLNRKLAESRTLNRVQEKMSADRDALEERIINRVQAEQKAKDRSDICQDAIVVIFTILLLFTCLWAGDKTTELAFKKFRLLFV